MTDKELQSFLVWDRSQFTFTQLSDEWKTWVKSTIQSAKVEVGGKGRIRPNDSVAYLCQIMQVFEGLRKGITVDDLRGKYVSGLVMSGFPPQTDASIFFLVALQKSQERGYVAYEDTGWGANEKRFFHLTLAGQRLAESVKIAIEPTSTPKATTSASCTQGGTEEAKTNDAASQSHVSVWKNADEVVGIAKELLAEISEADEREQDGMISENYEPCSYEKIISLTNELEAIHQEPRFAGVDDSFFPGTGNDLVDNANQAISSIFSYASDLLTRIGLGRFYTRDYPIRDDYKKIYRLVSNLKNRREELESEPAVADYLKNLSRQLLQQNTTNQDGKNVLEMATAKQRFAVLDEDTKQSVMFDPADAVVWGPVEYGQDWDGIEEVWTYQVEEWLYRHHSGHWTLIDERTHWEAPLRANNR